ncbi:MAG: hypothetical protein FJW66_05515, partial [Actinobacteria bacterium]|nr:hypothetical protein [Actinomycetota bacterium]
NEEIWQIDFNGQNKTMISKPGGRYRVPKYSIDGEKIVLQGYDDNGKPQVFIMDKNGENVTQLTNSPEGAGIPIFSPDNKHIVYNSRINGYEQIFIMGLDGSGKTQLTNFPGDDWGAVLVYQVTE